MGLLFRGPDTCPVSLLRVSQKSSGLERTLLLSLESPLRVPTWLKNPTLTLLFPGCPTLSTPQRLSFGSRESTLFLRVKRRSIVLPTLLKVRCPKFLCILLPAAPPPSVAQTFFLKPPTVKVVSIHSLNSVKTQF